MDQQVVVPPKLWLMRLNAGLTVVGLGLAIWTVLSVLNNPFGGMRAPAYLIICIFGWIGFNRGFALWQQFTRSGVWRGILRVAKWVLPFVLPVLIVRASEEQVQAQQLDIAAHDLAPVIAYADTRTNHDFIAVQAPAPRFPTPVNYQDTGPTYALWLRASGVDLEGYTLSYDSQTRRWERRHNNRPNASPASDGRCILNDAVWQCTDAQTAAAPTLAN